LDGAVFSVLLADHAALCEALEHVTDVTARGWNDEQIARSLGDRAHRW
jgi:hypothetical protein